MVSEAGTEQRWQEGGGGATELRPPGQRGSPWQTNLVSLFKAKDSAAGPRRSTGECRPAGVTDAGGGGGGGGGGVGGAGGGVAPSGW